MKLDKVLEKAINKEENVKFLSMLKKDWKNEIIEFTSQDLNINSAVEKAAQKGLKRYLIIMGNQH